MNCPASNSSGGIELDQKLDHVRRESVKAPHSASTERWSNPSGGSQIHAAGNLEARITQRTGLTEQHLVSIGAKEGFARRLRPVGHHDAGKAPCLARSAGTRSTFVGNRHACTERGVEQRLLRLGVEAAGGNLGPHFDQHRPLRDRPRSREGEFLALAHRRNPIGRAAQRPGHASRSERLGIFSWGCGCVWNRRQGSPRLPCCRGRTTS